MPENKSRDKLVAATVTDREKAIIDGAAAHRGLTTSDFLRSLAIREVKEMLRDGLDRQEEKD